MKRTATTLALLAGLGGGCVSPANKAKAQKDTAPSTGYFNRVTKSKEIPGITGPTGEPVAVGARGATPSDPKPATPPAGYATVGGSDVQPAGSSKQADCDGNCAYVPGLTPGLKHGLTGKLLHHGPRGDGSIYGAAPANPPGILPVPGMGPPGAVAAVGAINPAMMQPPTNQRSAIKFISPPGMKITWQLPNGAFADEASALTAPASYNFTQAQVYRLKLSSILPNYPGKMFYPTLEVVAANPKTVKFLAHCSIPIGFTNEDFDQAIAGNMVVKVVYLPDREFADFATVAGAEEIVSTRLDPGADPIAEAQRRGSILAILTLGGIDLENRFSPAMNQPSPYVAPQGMMLPPGATMLPPGATTPGGTPPSPMTNPTPVPMPMPTSPPMNPAPVYPPPDGLRSQSLPSLPPSAPASLPPTLKDTTSARPGFLPPTK